MVAERYEFGDFRLELRERRLTRRDRPVHLEPKSFDLLCHLVQRAGTLVTKQELIDSVWARAAVSDNALSRVVHQVRAALDDHADAPAYIATVAGSGYRFIAPVAPFAAPGPGSAEHSTTRPRILRAASIALVVLALGAALAWMGLGTGPTSQPRIERIAVLPLTNLTGDDEQQYLVQGIHESLIAELSRAGGLDVISRTSVMHYRGSDETVTEIADDLDVDAVVEGSVMRENGQLFVTVQLIAARPEHPLWTERFEQDPSEVFDVSAEIASSIAAEIGVDLSPMQDTLLAARRAVSPQAYNAFLRGRLHFEKKTPKDYREAQASFRRAIELDPQFAAAYAGLAHTYGSAAVWGVENPSVAMPKARSLAKQALALDDTLVDAKLMLAGVSFYWDRDVTAAEAALRRVLERNPSSAPAYRILADVYAVTGRLDDASAAMEHARELDPLSPTSQIKPTFGMYLDRDYEQAVEQVRAGLKFYPEFWQGHWVLCLSLSAMGQHDAAIAACKRAVKYSGKGSVALGGLGYVLARAGRQAEAREIIAELEALRATQYVGSANLAVIHGALGELDAAFDELEQAYEHRDWLLINIQHESFFDPLREDERFHRLAQAETPSSG